MCGVCKDLHESQATTVDLLASSVHGDRLLLQVELARLERGRRLILLFKFASYPDLLLFEVLRTGVLLLALGLGLCILGAQLPMSGKREEWEGFVAQSLQHTRTHSTFLIPCKSGILLPRRWTPSVIQRLRAKRC